MEGRLRTGYCSTGNKHLDRGSFLDLHILQGTEDSVLVFGRDGHGSRPTLATSLLLVRHALSLAANSGL